MKNEYTALLRGFLQHKDWQSLAQLSEMAERITGSGEAIEEISKIHREEVNNFVNGHDGAAGQKLVEQVLTALSPLTRASGSNQQVRVNHLELENAILRKISTNLRRAQRVAQLGYWDWDLETGDWHGSEQLAEILAVDELPGNSHEDYLQFVHPDDRDSLKKLVHNSLGRGSEYQASYRIIKSDGEPRYVEEFGDVILGDDGKAQHVTAVVHDDTERRRAEEQSILLKYHDPVTELPNNDYFLGHLQHTMAMAERDGRTLTTMVIDLDNFWEVKDLLGQETSDSILKEIGQRISALVGEEGMVAYMGSEEFAILAPSDFAADQAARLARDVLNVLSLPFAETGRDIHLTASMGIANYPTDANTPAVLLQRAKISVYRAKADGGNRFEFFNEEMADTVMEHSAIRRAMRPALKNGEFTLHYQPKIDLASGNLAGLEALIRWNSDELGAVSPGKFIPLAEQTPFIQSLGDWILETACNQYRSWQEMGFSPPPVAVNIAGPQLRPELLELIERTLLKTEMDTRALHLELTENSLVQNIDGAVELLEGLKKLGLTLSIDDFGTGYSSLSYLQRFPVDVLKIDQSFVRDIDENSGSIAIVRATIAMAHSLDLEIVAEGVETRSHLDTLKDMGCNQVQGFFISRPAPAEEISTFFDPDWNLWNTLDC